LVVPLWGVLPEMAIYNTAVLVAFTLTAWGLARLARELTGDDLCGMLAGILFAGVPYHYAHLQGQLHLISMGWVPLYVVHMSAREAVEAVAVARGLGGNVFGETCPQYLYLSLEEHLSAPGFEGAKYVCSTPVRSREEGHQRDLWRFLRTDDLSVVSTDHCPFCFKEQKELGLGDFSKIPNGIGGVEHRMELLYQGWSTGRSRSNGGSRRAARRRPACSACTRARARSRPAPTPTSSSTTRTAVPGSAWTRTT
jgi:hypothetical protein